jgi:hypothetical protein
MKKVKKFNKQPDHSIISRGMNGAIHYIDSFCIEIENTKNYSVDYLLALLFSSSPGWIKKLSKLRNILVKPFGLRTGALPEPKTSDTSLQYNIGERAVFFSVIDRSESEIVMAEDDKHLYFRASLFVEKVSDQNYAKVYLTTLVQFHNIGGKLYFTPVKPFHKLLMRSLLTRFSKKFN